MDVLVLQIFVSFLLVASSLVLFAVSAKQGDHAHADRLSLLPLEEEPSDSSLDPPPPERRFRASSIRIVDPSRFSRRLRARRARASPASAPRADRESSTKIARLDDSALRRREIDAE